MTVRRRRRGFERAGSFRVDETGLPARRLRELRLALAWRRAAGETLAARARDVRVVRGVLEVRLPAGLWATTLDELLPRLAGRVARRLPGLRIRRCRLLVVGEEPGEARKVDPSEERT